MYPFFMHIGGFVFIFPNKNNIILKNGKNFNKWGVQKSINWKSRVAENDF